MSKYNARCFVEPSIGLSIARNRGAEEAKGEWLCYIDDDARLQAGYIDRALWVIENFDFDCFGGMYYAWHLFEKPKWMNDNFGTKTPLRETVGGIEASKLSGGNFLIKKEILKRVNGFPTNFGMTGRKLAYGEENVVQVRLLERGYKLGFDPELKVDHAVLSHKLKLWWQLKNEFAHGRDRFMVSPLPLTDILINYLRSMYGILKRLPVCLTKVFFYKEYYWQNFMMDCFSNLAYNTGRIYSYLDVLGTKYKLWY